MPRGGDRDPCIPNSGKMITSFTAGPRSSGFANSSTDLYSPIRLLDHSRSEIYSLSCWYRHVYLEFNVGKLYPRREAPSSKTLSWRDHKQRGSPSRLVGRNGRAVRTSSN